MSENSNFARAATAAGIVFAGPSPESIEAFGLKHTARDLAKKAGVPIVPGSKGLVTTEHEAVQVAKGLGFPVSYLSILPGRFNKLTALGHAQSHRGRWWNGLAYLQLRIRSARVIRHSPIQR